MPVVHRSLLALTLVAAACAAPRGPRSMLPPQEPGHEPPTPAGGEWGSRFVVEATAIPAVWLISDADGVAPGADEINGYGYGLRAAFRSHDQSIGFLYQGFDSDDGGLDVKTLALDFDVRTLLDDGTGILFLRAGAGIGGAWLDNVGGADLGTELATQLRVGIDIQPNARFAIGASLGGILFGHPGETEAYGTFLSLGVSLIF